MRTIYAPMMFRIFIPVVALLLVGVASPARAEVDAARTKKARMEMARKVVSMVTTRDRYKKLMVQMSDQMLAASKQQGAKLPPDMNTKLIKVVSEAIPYDEMIDWSAQLYADRFTLAELSKLRDFYRTPLGKKLAEAIPEMGGEVGQKIGTILPRRLPALMKKHGLAP